MKARYNNNEMSRLTQADLESRAFFLPIDKVASDYNGGRDVLPVLKEYGTISAVTDLCILRGGFVSSNYYANNDENNLSARAGYFWSASPFSSSSGSAVRTDGEWGDYYPYKRLIAARPASLFSSSILKSPNAVREKVGFFKKGVLRYSEGMYPQDAVDDDTHATLESEYQKVKEGKGSRLVENGRGFTFDTRAYDEYGGQFKPERYKEYEYNGQRYIRISANLYTHNSNAATLSTGREVIHKQNYVWLKVEPIVYLINEEKDENGKVVGVAEKAMYAGVQFDRRSTQYDASFAKIYAELRYAVESTESQLAPSEYVLSDKYTNICENCFAGIKGLNRVLFSASVKAIGAKAFPTEEFGFAYIDKKTGLFAVSKSQPTSEMADEFLELGRLKKIVNIDEEKTSSAVLKNAILCGKQKFMPKEVLLANFGKRDILNLYVNNNDKKWGELVKRTGYIDLPEETKANSLEALFKIYYALGGFEKEGNIRDEAFDYVLALTNKYSPDKFHEKFGPFASSDVGYNPEYAQFFKLYFGDNEDFMVFEDDDEDERDYLADAYKLWGNVRKQYPHHMIKTTTDNFRLTPEMVKDCLIEPTE